MAQYLGQIPLSPAAPCVPAAPGWPSAPSAPSWPSCPRCPGGPGGPGIPSTPGFPGGPGGPGGPSSPARHQSMKWFYFEFCTSQKVLVIPWKIVPFAFFKVKDWKKKLSLSLSFGTNENFNIDQQASELITDPGYPYWKYGHAEASGAGRSFIGIVGSYLFILVHLVRICAISNPNDIVLLTCGPRRSRNDFLAEPWCSIISNRPWISWFPDRPWRALWPRWPCHCICPIRSWWPIWTRFSGLPWSSRRPWRPSRTGSTRRRRLVVTRLHRSTPGFSWDAWSAMVSASSWVAWGPRWASGSRDTARFTTRSLAGSAVVWNGAIP